MCVTSSSSSYGDRASLCVCVDVKLPVRAIPFYANHRSVPTGPFRLALDLLPNFLTLK